MRALTIRDVLAWCKRCCECNATQSNSGVDPRALLFAEAVSIFCSHVDSTEMRRQRAVSVARVFHFGKEDIANVLTASPAVAVGNDVVSVGHVRFSRPARVYILLPFIDIFALCYMRIAPRSRRRKMPTSA